MIRPSFFQGFSATIDYYNIKVTDAITVPTPDGHHQRLLRQPSPRLRVESSLYVIRRNPISSQLDGSPADTPGLFGPLSTWASSTTDGVDLTFDYRHTLGTILDTPAKFSLNFGGNWTHSHKFQATAVVDQSRVRGLVQRQLRLRGGHSPKYIVQRAHDARRWAASISRCCGVTSARCYEGIESIAFTRLHRPDLLGRCSAARS